MITKLGKRNVWKINDYTLVTSLPPVWRMTNNVDDNSKLELSMDEEGRLIIEPVRDQGGKKDGKEEGSH
ncbi:MAG: AbrB/MazE/SpoVT family DNA-binding domain-containing protein [Thermoplasmata archaeon]